MSTPASEIHDTPLGAPPRPLTEEVLQSAEEAVLANPASADILQGGEPLPEAADPAPGRVRYADRLARRVAEKPVQSALLALAAGALLAALVKAALSRRH
ncbi:MAG: hypothetical protein Q8O29_05415 [Polaromonas sp.]|uniref:hypothetical protein n=1 Tax=Polaromonas sp. TaxID=1869339 RepID=UPI0027331406|nr:hypothetical protein [Polaromonas sp.]MDP2817709.1 hypothetical protein [Polaromonas sp.]